MKLLTRINRNFLITAVALFAVWSFIFYFSLRSLIHYQVDEDLEDERDQVVYLFGQNGKLPVSQSLAGELVEVQRVDSFQNISSQLSDTTFIDQMENEPVPYRMITFELKNSSGRYLVTLGESQFETDDLVSLILVFILLFVLALFVVLYNLNRRTSKNIWLPFNNTLEQLKSFDLAGINKISFPHTRITEFDELNLSLNKMTQKIYGDYSRLKQFTENASHEIQTPLSIIRSKIEMLIQSEDISEAQMNSIQQINDSVSRLSKLNTALLTLTKIENQQFTDAEEIHLASFIQNKLNVLDEMIQQKKITVSIEGNDDAVVKMNASLADLLFDNIIGNAIKHNIEGGFIKISFQENNLTISNSGGELQMPNEKLFDRFVKNNPSSDSLGLGLAMVKEICKMNNFNLDFISQKNHHIISLVFKT
ncbi:MAG: HAMP domain-containing histidine kinase [Chitinophagales bacterium]|nr:HAMP domain-containing histidine kinase [Chitinophagales bacterium]